MKLSQKEIDFIYNNIDKLKEELANKYTTYTLQGKTVQLNAEQILLQSAKYLVDEEYSNSKQNSSIIANKEVLEEVGEILKDMSKNEYMQDAYLGLETQALFTVTPEQYKNPDYDTDNSIGLTDSSATFVPTAKIGSVIGNATATVAPSVFNGGKRVINTINQIDDDIGRYIQYQKDKLPDSFVNKWVTKEIDQNVLNDIFNESLPASSGLGALWGIGVNVIDKKEEIRDTIKNVLSNDSND